MGTNLLHYRPWRGRFHDPAWSVLPIARVALWMIFRRKLFWLLYGLALLVFFTFFFGQYLLAWAETQSAEQSVAVGLAQVEPARLIRIFREMLRLDGSGYTYRNFFWYQGYMVMIVLALAGSILVGNDFHFSSLPFYLAKPLSRWHYLLGKCLAVAVFVNLMTTLPAIGLFVQYGFLDSWSYFLDNGRLFAGILSYGLVLTAVLSLLLVATASWLRRTVPMIMAWTTLFVFCRLLSAAVVDGFHYDPRWKLIDLWNNTYVVGNACLGMPVNTLRGQQPPVYAAGLVLGGVCLLCLTYLSLRIRAVEVVR
jgi:ABC-type transport system involved in multi-copper enzyme maturation permease subunit